MVCVGRYERPLAAVRTARRLFTTLSGSDGCSPASTQAIPSLISGMFFDRLLVQMLQLRRAVRIFLLRRTLPNHLIGIATTTRHLVRIFSQTPLSLQAIQAGQPVAMSMHGPMRTGSTVAGSASSKAGNISGLMARSTRSMALHTRA